MCRAAGKRMEDGGTNGDVVSFGDGLCDGVGDNGPGVECGVNRGHEHGGGGFGGVLQDGADKAVMDGGCVGEVLV